MTDIFSSFDPATNSLFSLSSIGFWAIRFIIAVFFLPTFWLMPNRLYATSNTLSTPIFDQVTRTFGTHLKGFPSLLGALFIMINLINIMGNIPYAFRFSSHLLFSLSLGLPIWARLIISGIQESPSYAAAHLLPAGAPIWLNPALILVETLRILVRPLTLCLRLTANITAGHVVIGLVGSFLSGALLAGDSISISYLLLIETGYTIFEFGVSIIQAYIFCLLLSLYRDDHPAS